MSEINLRCKKHVRRGNILIVEDSIVNAAVLADMLENIGLFNIHIAASEKEAIALFSKALDIIFMDIHLTDSDGFKLTQHYRKDFPKKDTPIICWSTIADSKRKEYIASGMDDFLPKPATLMQVIEILECWVPHKFFHQEMIPTPIIFHNKKR